MKPSPHHRNTPPSPHHCTTPSPHHRRKVGGLWGCWEERRQPQGAVHHRRKVGGLWRGLGRASSSHRVPFTTDARSVGSGGGWEERRLAVGCRSPPTQGRWAPSVGNPIGSQPEFQLTDQQKSEIGCRLNAYALNPEEDLEWNVVRERIQTALQLFTACHVLEFPVLSLRGINAHSGKKQPAGFTGACFLCRVFIRESYGDPNDDQNAQYKPKGVHPH